MLAPLRAIAFGLMTLVLSWHGAGVPLESADECCACEEAEAMARTASVDRAAEGAVDEGAEDAHESCPPGCDDCSCCGGASMLATLASSMADAVPVRSVARRSSIVPDAPRGERSGVFRPPRA